MLCRHEEPIAERHGGPLVRQRKERITRSLPDSLVGADEGQTTDELLAQARSEGRPDDGKRTRIILHNACR